MVAQRWISLTLLMGLVLASCTGEDQETLEYCQAASELSSLETLLSPESVRDPGQVQEAFETFEDSLDDLQARAPASIRDDIGQLGAAVDDVIASMAAVDFDLTLLDGDAASNLLAPFAQPAVQRALERVEAFDTLNCSQTAPPATAAPSNSDQGDSDDAPQPQPTVPPPPTPDPVVALAAEYGDLVRTTFSDDEIDNMLAYAEVSGVDELVQAIIGGDLTIDELDIFLQRTGDGVPFAFGDDPDLDILWNACATQDWAACDGLYTSSPLNSLYQRFADSCGQVSEEPTGGQCSTVMSN